MNTGPRTLLVCISYVFVISLWRNIRTNKKSSVIEVHKKKINLYTLRTRIDVQAWQPQSKQQRQHIGGPGVWLACLLPEEASTEIGINVDVQLVVRARSSVGALVNGWSVSEQTRSVFTYLYYDLWEKRLFADSSRLGLLLPR